MTGRDFLRACVAGYEVGPRVGMCMGPEHIAQGWHSGATVGVFAAAAGAVAALRLDAEKTVHALGIGGTQSAGLMAAQFGAMVKRMHAGRAAQADSMAHCSRRTVLRASSMCSRTRMAAFAARSRARPTASIWRNSSMAWACARDHAHRAEVLLMRRQQPHDTRRDPRHAGAPPFRARRRGARRRARLRVTVDHVGWKYVPQGSTSAQLNLPYCVATLLLEGDVFVGQFSEDKVADPQRMALADRVQVLEDPAITARGPMLRHMVRVEVLLRDLRTAAGGKPSRRSAAANTRLRAKAGDRRRR